MKRLLIVLCGIIVLLAGLFFSLPLLLSSESVRSQITNRLTELTGRQVSFSDNPKISLRPFFSIEIRDLIVENNDISEDTPPLLKADQLQAQLDILPALFGHVSLSNFNLLRARINLRVHQNGNSNWKFTSGSLYEAFQDMQNLSDPERNDTVIANVKLGKFTLIDGAIVFKDLVSGYTEEITSINGTVSWLDTEVGLQINGTGIWRGENISTTADFSEPLKLIAGGESLVSVDVESAPVNLQFDGTANRLSDLFIVGTLNLSTPSSERLSDITNIWLGDYRSLELEGKIEATKKNLRLSDASIAVSDNRAVGALSFSFDDVGSSKIDGTLAFNTLDFSNLFSGHNEGLEATVKSQRQSIDIDLRISANTVNAGYVSLEQVAAIVTSKSSGWMLEIGDALAFGGNLVARIGEQGSDGKIQAFLEADLKDADASTLSGLFEDNLIKFSGKTDIMAYLRAANIGSLLSRNGLDGSFETSLRSGSITGIDLIQFMHNLKLENETQAYKGLAASGSTPVDTFYMHMNLAKSIATIEKSSLAFDQARIQLMGLVDFKSGNLSLRAQPADTNGFFHDRIYLGGTLQQPLISVQSSQGN